MKIKFAVSNYRKQPADNKFNPKLSNYWRSVYYDLFNGWWD